MGGADELFGTEQTPSVSGADQLFAGEESQADNRLKFVMDETIDETPERTARALEIQKKTGIPKKFIDENFDEIDKTARQSDFDPKKFTKSNPKVSDWLTRNPDYAPLIREDESVGALESAISNTSKFFSSGESWSDVLQKRTESAGHALNLQLAGAEQTVAMARQAPSEFAGHFGAQINRAAAKGMAYLVAPDWALTPEQIKTKETFINRIALEPGYSQTAINSISKDPLFVEGMDRASYHTERIKELQPKVPEWSGKDLIGTAYESFLTSVLPMMATAYAGGGVLGGTSVFSGQVYTQNLAEDLNEGMPLSLAQEHASWKVLSEGIPESIPLSVAMKAGKGFWSKTLTIALVEGVEEGLTEMADVAYETLKLDKDISFKEAVNRTFKAMAIGSITGGGMGAVSSIPTAIENHKLKQKAKVQEDFFTALGENATNSKLRERLPDSYQEIIGELTKDGPVENVYAPVEFFQSHFQEQGIDPRQLATELGIQRQYDEAVNIGGKISIPTAVYAKDIAATEHNALFAKELSFGPDQMSTRETEEFLKEAEKEKEPETDAFAESLETAMTPIRDQLKTIYPADVADHNAAVIEARLRTRAQRLGIDPQELMKRRPMQIMEGGEETGPELQQVSSDLKSWIMDYHVARIYGNTGAIKSLKSSIDKAAKNEGVETDKILSNDPFTNFTYEERKELATKSTDEIKKAIAPYLQEGELFQSGKDIKRGSISITPTGDIIRLFKAKNLSSFLHELGHRWLFELEDDAALPEAPQQIKDDLAATLKYLGVESAEQLDITKFQKGTKEYDRAVTANEKWAQGIEAYLKEGKAPSSALRRVFAQIRAWFVAVYDALKQGRLDAELNPEIRGVFDRLLATDQEIAAAKAEANAVPIFTTAADAGYTDAEFAAYRKTIEDANLEEREELDAKVMKEYKKTLTDLWKEEKTKVQAEVEAELDKDPIYAAMAKMKENGVKIARSEAGSLPRSLTAKDGIPADMAAEMLGFTSGEAMVKALVSVEARGARVQRETNILMDHRFGNLLTDGTLVEEARKAVMGDGRAKIIEAEIKALNKKAREVKPFVKAKEKAQTEQKRAGRDLYKALVPKLADVREHAAAVIAGKPIRELRPMQYYNTARQASREAVNDVRKGDYLMAGYNKGRELLNLELYREAIKAQDMIEDGNQKLQKVFVADIKQSKSRNMDMVNAARAILASHGLGKTDAAPSSYLDKMRQYDPEIYENLRPIFEPAIASMKPYKDMTVEEYVGMRDAVLALMKTSRRSKQIEIDGRLIERDEAVANLVNRMMDFDKGKSQSLKSTLNDLQKTKIGLLSAKAALRRVESWITAMDGGADGVFRKFIWNPVSDAVNLYRDKKREIVAHYLVIVQQVAPTIKPGDIEAPEIGFKFRGKNELLHALLHTGNDSNKAKLLIGYGWGERNEEGVLNSSKWDAFEKRMRDQGVLTKVDYDFAQNVWDMMEGMKPALQEAHHRMYGYYFNEVTAKEFSNEFGTYRGGYVPAKVDVNVVQEAEQRKDAEEIVQGQNSFAFPTSGKGATMSRVEGYARPLQLDMRSIPAHIDWAMRFAYLEPAVKDVARVVLDKDFAKSMNGLDPTTINHMLVPWLQRTAQQITSTRGMNKWADKFWTGVRSRSGMQVMVLNVINTLQQYTGLTIAFTRVKPSNMRSAFWTYMTNHKEFSEEISEKSSFMRNRVFTAHNEVMQTIDDLLLNPSKYEKAKDFATKHGYFMQQATQGFVDQIVWNAAYNEALANGKPDKDAVRHGDSTVRETQGSFSPEDLSRFEAGTPFVRAFSMFYNYFNMQANLLGTEVANIASNELGLRKGAGRALYVYTFAFMIPAYIGGAIIRALVAGGLDEDDDDEYMDDLIRLFFGSQFEALTAMVPVAGPLLNTVVNQWNKKWYDDKITVSPAVTAVESAVRAPYSVYKSIVDDGNEKRAVKDTLSLIGMATGLPAGALGRPLGYLADVHQGKARPENALDVARGLISGQDVNR